MKLKLTAKQSLTTILAWALVTTRSGAAWWSAWICWSATATDAAGLGSSGC
jgi:hypothetical protein